MNTLPKWLRIAGLLMLVALVMPILAACGDDDDDADPTEDTAGTTATSALLPRHIVSNVLIRGREHDPQVADVTSHLFYYEVTPKGFYFKTSGIYTDVVERTADGWRFRSRVMTLDVARLPDEDPGATR